MKRELTISIQPKHLVNILNGYKTLELRKTVPKGFKGWVYIYCTKGIKDILYKYKDKYYTQHYLTFTDYVEVLNSKVVARFWFDEYEKLEIGDDGCVWFINERHYYNAYPNTKPNILKDLCLGFDDVLDYVGYGDDFSLGCKLDKGYLWHIKKLEIFDTPLSLSDLDIKKPPQSWQYIYKREE